MATARRTVQAELDERLVSRARANTRRQRFELVVSPQLISEVAGVLARPKFERCVTPDEVADFLDMLRSNAVVHPDPAVVERATRDPDDDCLVALATAAKRCWSRATATCSTPTSATSRCSALATFSTDSPDATIRLSTMCSGWRLRARRCSAIA